MNDTVQARLEAVWRDQSGRIVATLTRLCGDLGRAEELAQDALLEALQRWPEQGVPDNPGAWLMTVARNRALDQLRRNRLMGSKHALLAATDREELESDEQLVQALDAAVVGCGAYGSYDLSSIATAHRLEHRP